MTGRVLVLAAVAALGAGCGEGRSAPPGVGDPAPAFSGTTLDGRVVTREALEGRPVLLNLWATWCAPCRFETPYLEDVHQRFSPEGLHVVGVSVDGRGARDDVEGFLEEMGVTYTQLLDPAGEVLDLFAVFGLPVTYLLDPDGTILWSRLGPVHEGDVGMEDAIREALAGA